MKVKEEYIYLVGCSKMKSDRKELHQAQHLYTSPLFNARADYVEAMIEQDRAKGHESNWNIISAKHSVMSPTEYVMPYDYTIDQMSPLDKSVWAMFCAACVMELVDSSITRPRDVIVMLLMGRSYSDQIAKHLTVGGFRTYNPFKGLAIGQQIKELKEHTAAIKRIQCEQEGTTGGSELVSAAEEYRRGLGCTEDYDCEESDTEVETKLGQLEMFS